jgi:predicted enzyme related to lactoylglutathione lyase
MSLDLFAGLAVSDLKAAVGWYSALFGSEPSFYPNDVEAVWSLGEHQFAYVEALPDKAGRGLMTLFVEDLDERVASAATRGIEPSTRETYENGVRKVTFTDPDGNEVGFGGGPV